MSWIKDHPRGWQIYLKVNAGAKVSELMAIHEGRLKIRLHAPAVEGKANAELLKFWQKKLGITKSQLHLLKGELQSLKTLLIEDVPKEKIVDLVSKSLNMTSEELEKL